MTTQRASIRVAIVAPRRSILDRLLGDRCPYCGRRDRRPTSHISAGRCLADREAITRRWYELDCPPGPF